MAQELLARLERSLLSQEQALSSTEHNRLELAEFLDATQQRFTPASVLIGLVPRADGLHVLLTKRTEHLRHHAGQISFPGGRIEADDADPAHAALREAQEEIGLGAEAVSLLGYLQPMLTITGYRVYPVVALIDASYIAEADGVEVEALFEAPLALFLDPANEHGFELQFQGKARRLVEFRWQEFRIWGATATMLINLRERMRLPA